MLTAFFALQRASRIHRMRKGEAGASAVEYGLLVALIAAVIVVAVIIFGDFVADVFTDTCTAIDAGQTAGGVTGDTANCT